MPHLPPPLSPKVIHAHCQVVSAAGEAKDPVSNFLELSIACQNCNSLNLTTNLNSYDLKVAAIKSFATDIIFLSDTRLVSNKGIKGIQRLKNSFRDARGRKYDVFANSESNSRGVAILTAVELGITPTTVHIDPEENFIFIRTSLLGKNLLLGAIYGPNNTSRDFYRRISAILELYTNCSIIIGGDWNTVLDHSPVGNNIDIFKMEATVYRTRKILSF